MGILIVLKAYGVLCLICTVAAFAIFALEQRAFNRQVCRERERRREELRYRTPADQRRILREHIKVMGGSGGRR